MHKTERPHHSICLGARATRTTPHRGRCPSPTQARDHTCPSDRTLQSSLLQTSRQPTRPSGAGASPRCLEGGPRPGPQDSELQVPRTQLFLSGRTTPSLGDREQVCLLEEQSALHPVLVQHWDSEAGPQTGQGRG